MTKELNEELRDKTCGTCAQRIGEECGVDGYEVWEDTEACKYYCEDE